MMKRNLLSAAFALMALAVSADEGMWMLTDLKAQNEAAMMDLGLQIPIEEVYNPDGIALKDAVVHFGGGCTGEIISAEGLVLTNHHCGYGAIQQHSSVDHDYLTNGFWAMNRNEELPCKGLTVTFIDRILDVTTYVNEQLKKDDDPNGINYLSPKYLATVADRFAKAENIQITPATRLELKPFYGGNKYYLFVKTVYNDIRMVGAPPSSIGKFGADTDNWMWPRHTGDFSLFRIYADKNGQPAEYSKDNVPLQVKKHLTISLAGVKEGDFTFVMGFPGRNWRYMISDEVKERMQTTNFMRHHVREARQAVLMDQMLKDPAVRIHYASKYASSANYWKNAIGMNEGLVRLKVLDTKEKQQEQLLAMGREKGIVMDGRDIGTVVFPDAELKIFVTATAQIRAMRRYKELQAKGMPADFDDILKNVEERDYIDTHRATSPLHQADDALVLDNSNLTIAEQKQWLMKLLEERTK